MDGKFSVGYRDAVVRTVVNLDRETTASYTLVLEAIGRHQPTHRVHMGWASRSQALSPRLCPDASGERATRPSVYYCALAGREARRMVLHAKVVWQGLCGSHAGEQHVDKSLQNQEYKAEREEGMAQG